MFIIILLCSVLVSVIRFQRNNIEGTFIQIKSLLFIGSRVYISWGQSGPPLFLDPHTDHSRISYRFQLFDIQQRRRCDDAAHQWGIAQCHMFCNSLMHNDDYLLW